MCRLLLRFAYRGLTHRTVATIQNVVKQGKQNVFSRIFHAKRDRSSIATWRQDLTNVLQIFNVRFVGSASYLLRASFQTELAINTHKLVVDTHRNVLTGQAGAHAPGERQSVTTTFSIHQSQNADRFLDSSPVSGCEHFIGVVNLTRT